MSIIELTLQANKKHNKHQHNTYVCGTQSRVPFWPNKFFLNETCELSIEPIKYFGSYNQRQQKVLNDHGAQKSKVFYDSDIAFQRKFNFSSEEVEQYQGKFQHIPGFKYIAQKDKTAKILRKGNHDKYFPKQYVLPDESNKVKFNNQKMIFKPSETSLGSGIKIINNMYELQQATKSYCYQQNKTAVLQEFLEGPLINGRKFDIRILIVQTSIDPVSVYIYKDGFVRFSSLDYNETIFNDPKTPKEILKRMGATNSHISQVYLDRSFKATWRLQEYFNYMKEHDKQFSEDNFWEQITDIVREFFNADVVQYEMDSIKIEQKHPSQYFKQFGVDIFPLKNGSYRMIEINSHPGYNTIFESEQGLYDDFFIDLINIGSIRPKQTKIYCNQQCKQQFLDSTFDSHLTDDEKIALLQFYDERKHTRKFQPVKPLDEVKNVGKYNKAMLNYWDKLDYPFNNRTQIN